MKVVVVGGTGLIGSKLVAKLGEDGHEAVAAAPNTGVNTLTGEGLDAALVGAEVVVDVSNSPILSDPEVSEFFDTSTRNVLAAESAAGVSHHVALSVVGAERLPRSDYLRAKMLQETLIEKSGIPYSLVHATQFFEFVARIADSSAVGDEVRFAPVAFQPVASDDVVLAVYAATVGSPSNATVEVGGPEEFPMDEFFRMALSLRGDEREVVTDPHARYFGTELEERSLVPSPGATLGTIRYADWATR
jgi:uncharacterized protein YbjT (DUF2867 family)